MYYNRQGRLRTKLQYREKYGRRLCDGDDDNDDGDRHTQKLSIFRLTSLKSELRRCYTRFMHFCR